MLVGAAGSVLWSVDAARADLSWEHTGTLRVSKQKQPMLRFKMYNNWTPQRHRLLFNYSVHNLAGLGRISDQIPMGPTFLTSLSSASPLGALSPTSLSGTPLSFGKAPGVLAASRQRCIHRLKVELKTLDDSASCSASMMIVSSPTNRSPSISSPSRVALFSNACVLIRGRL
jgi:hypothetical protein